VFKNLTVLAVLVGGCAGNPVLTPRAEDASAPRDFYRALNPGKPGCKPAVSVLHENEVGDRKYHEVSRISATCYPGAPAVCRQTLSERACELKADALILSQAPEGGATPAGASGQSAISVSARAVNWVTE
jgi:hypothetical protein